MGGGGDVNVHTDAKMKTEQHLEMPTMMTMSMAVMLLMIDDDITMMII